MNMSGRSLKGARSLSLEETAYYLWVDEGKVGRPLTSERIRTIERDAIQKCQDWCKRHGVTLKDLLTAEIPENDLTYRILIDEQNDEE